MYARLAAVAVAGLMVLAACDNDSEPTPDPALAFCDSATSLAAAVVSFRQMDAQDTIEDIQTSAAAVQAAFQALETSAGNLAESQVSDIQGAVDDLQSAVSDIPDTDTVNQALASLAPQVAALREAVNAAGDTNCAAVLIEAQASAAAEEAEEAAATMEAEASAAAEEVAATMEADAEDAEGAVDAAEDAVESMLPEESPEG